MISGICPRVALRKLRMLIILLTVAVVVPSRAQTLSVLDNFETSAQPHGNLVRDDVGNLYGVQAYTVFKLDTAGHMTSLITFPPDPLHGGPIDGSALNSNLLIDSAGNLYGTTPEGGLVQCFFTGPGLPIEDDGCGTIFELTPSGEKTVLYNFAGGNFGPDGAFPYSGLVRDQAGNFFSSTLGGGHYDCSLDGLGMGCGTISKFDTNGNEIILYDYGRQTGLVLDMAGNLFGVSGASLFKLDTVGAFTLLYTFAGGTDGSEVRGGLAIDAAGNLYGTTYLGGLLSCMTGGAAVGCGVVFKIDPSGKETVLYTFTGGAGDGANPNSGVVLDDYGNLYGTTSLGGTANVGTVFKVDATGIETVLHNFTGGSDGGSPDTGLLLDSFGNLYGTTLTGGDLSCATGGCGVIFKLAPTTLDFSLSASALLPNNINPGGSSTASLSLTAQAGFSGSIVLACSVSPTPAYAPQCSISPDSITPGTPATLTVTTFAPVIALHSSTDTEGFNMLWVSLIGCVTIGKCGLKSRHNMVWLILVCLLMAGLVFQVACGGSGTPINDHSQGTPAGTYVVTITGTDESSSIQHSTTTTVNVQ